MGALRDGADVGYSRKIGEPNYGSRGASVNLQIEKELLLVEDAGQVRQQIEELFELARAAVESELACSHDCPVSRTSAQASPSPGITESQLHAIRSLSQRKQVDPHVLLQAHGGPASLEQLTRQQASRLISELDSLPGAA